MTYAEFQTTSTGWNGKDFTGPTKPIPALGSDGVFVLDGRLSLPNMIEAAHNRAKQLKNVKPGITGFILHQGTSFTQSKPISGFIPTPQ